MGIDFNLDLLGVSVFRLFLSLCCGLVLGIERKLHQQAIGMRTLILISVASCLLGMLSTYMAGCHDLAMMVNGDPTRIAAGVVSGIGFLGGGAIMVQGLNIKGLTTAAIIWTTSAVGLSIGGGLYLPSVLTIIFVLISLISLEKIEGKYFPAAKTKSLHLVFENDNVDFQKIRNVLQKNGLIINDVNMSRTTKPYKFALRYSIKSPKNMDYKAIANELSEIFELNKFAIVD